MKFKVGDRVIAQRGAPYSITTKRLERACCRD